MPNTLEGRILCDTNVLLRFANSGDVRHGLVSHALSALVAIGFRLAYAPQSLREFWNVATRPADVNGLGLSILKADELASYVEDQFEILPDTDAMHDLWRRLVVEHEVRGVQVHDARLAASARVDGCRAILTLNDPDFRRFGVAPWHPRDVPAFLAA